MKNKIFFTLLCIALSSALRAEQLFTQSFVDTPIEMLVDTYNEWTGRTLIIQADLSQKISLKYSQLTKEEAMQAIETILAMNGVAMVPMGEKFLKVVNIANARQEGMSIEPFDPDKTYTSADQLMSQVIQLRYVVYPDVQEIVQQLLHGYGKVVKLDRVNSILVTDTSANIAKIAEILEMVDQPLEKIEPRIYQLKYAKAGEISGKLKELVEAAKTKKSEQMVVAAPRTVPGVIRAPRTVSKTASGDDSFADETQMIQGAVKFVSDERTNILIIFSKAANFDFFDRIIKVLDVPVDPEVVVETINLEYAEAAEIAGILNEFVGAAKETEKTTSTATGGDDGNKSIDDIIASRRTQPPSREISAAAKNAIGRLSADTKILSDERTNSLLLMGRRSDIEALKVVISDLDVMLEQVLIETMILSVGLKDKLQTGVEWVYDSAMPQEIEREQVFGFRPFDQLTNNIISTAFGYYGVFPELNLEMLVRAINEDAGSSILSTPVVLTTDNTEAKITIAKERPIVTSSVTGTSGTESRSTYEYRTIGIELTVTPHINPERFVLMEISQSADQIGEELVIAGDTVPEILKREVSATVAVQDKSTVILGGLIDKETKNVENGIPLLKDIPFLGRLFSFQSEEDNRAELIVLLTPYVLTNPEEASHETERRLQSSDVSHIEWPHGWSESPLANDEPDKDAEPEPKGFLESIFDGKDDESEMTNATETVEEMFQTLED